VFRRRARAAALIQRAFRRRSADSVWASNVPIRDELLSAQRLEDRARRLAEAQGTGRKGRGRPLARRLADNEAMLVEAYRDIVRSLNEGASITPAAEWLVDNFHVVEKQIREVRLDLPAGYYRQLPKLGSGELAGYPRVFGIAWTFVAHTDSHFDPDLLCRFLRAYQEVQSLTIGELWAVAITLRIVMVENLRRISERIVIGRAARAEADRCCDAILGVRGRPPEPALQVLKPWESAPPPDAFVVQLRRRLRDHDTLGAPALNWLDDQLARYGRNADTVVREDQHRQVASSLTVRNIVTSLRLISDVDWADLVERVSLADDLLKAGSAFADMDFATRNLYRDAIEELARGSGRDELDIARRAVDAARRAEADTCEVRRGDPGFHLIGGGRGAFEAAVGFRPPARAWSLRLIARLGLWGYMGAIALWGAWILGAPLAALWLLGVSPVGLAALAALGLFPAAELAVAIVNRRVTHGLRAKPLPALELKGGVPSRLRTVVAVPVLLSDRASVEAHIERLEIHHLSSPEGHLHFALLSDWPDAPHAEIPGDDELLQAAREGVARLNRKYGSAPGGDRFLLFHRRRVWAPSEGAWMGWERKRGKLSELNRVLRGAEDTTFIPIEGQVIPQGVRYVLTLDADTRLPRDCVRRLIGKMAHPLNLPRFDPESGRVVEGYAILQPRVTPALATEGEGSLYRRVTSSVGGIDPYAAAISDVYQDLFGEGSFTGKGIYDLDAFATALAERIPEATLLSHDLFEGVFARAGLASDVEVVEDFPERYDADCVRRHRWARGDWQLLPWILGLRRPAPGRSRAWARVPPVGRWKMLDNLRRTVSPGFTVAALCAGWLTPWPSAAVWTGWILSVFAIPPLIPVLGSLGARRPGVPVRARLHAFGGDLRLAFLQALLGVSLLPHQAWLMGDAIVRSLWRLTVSRRKLLEWVPAAQAAARLRFDMASFYRRMAPAVGLGAGAAALGFVAGPGSWVFCAVFGLVWMVSPGIAFEASRQPETRRWAGLPEDEAQALRMVARRTWRFFETFVTAEHNMLPPDNYQEDPAAVAGRTSPTNIGLYLLSAASARDLGWIGAMDALDRLEATLATLGRMGRFRGHFFNWYDTRDLRPLEPRYISSVDSGNLAGHLIALANAVAQWAAPQDARSRLKGVNDALMLAYRQATALRGEVRLRGWPRLERELVRLSQGIDAARQADEPLEQALRELADQTGPLIAAAEAVAAEVGGPAGGPEGVELVAWVRAVEASLASHLRDIEEGAAPLPRLTAVAAEARSLALQMEFGFLLDPDRSLLSIGYRVAEGELDPSCYDLLGSEARLASFVAIAKSDAPPKHWFRLGHAVTPVAHGAALISWSGSMFEYLMPSLVMRAPPGSILEQTNRLVVRRQIDYAASLRVPWGMSESAYAARDLEFTYQYLSFGVPSLGLKRGLADQIVIAPYATALAAMVEPKLAVRNFQQLAALGAEGRYGFYEAIDYTPSRVPDGQRFVLVRCFMAHHQGMSIVAIANALTGGAMRERFHAEPMVQATELLLEERMPREIVVTQPLVASKVAVAKPATPEASGVRRIGNPHTRTPAVHLLSNGRYSVMLTAAGSGYSRWRDQMITRWRADATQDDLGAYVYLRDVSTGAVWSAGHQPVGLEADEYEASFAEDRAEIARRDGALTTTMEVLVSPEDDAEVRRVTVHNAGLVTRDVEVTSYAELVLAPQGADVAHPAFSKLFVHTEHVAGVGALLATRRRRSREDPEVWAAHLAVVEGETTAPAEFDTDRAAFIGRGGDLRDPAGLAGRRLGGAVGYVLDPAFIQRRRLRIAPGASARISFWTLAAGSRREVLDLIDKHHDPAAFDRAANLAWTQALVQLHHLGVSRADAALHQELAAHIVYATPLLRPGSEALGRGAGGQPGLWRAGISGDLPIVLLRISEIHDLSLARQLIGATEYLRSKQLAFDLVLLNERAASYVQDLQIALEGLVRAAQSRAPLGDNTPPGRTIVLRADLIDPELPDLLGSVARVVLTGRAGSLAEQLDRVAEHRVRPRVPPRLKAPVAEPAPFARPELELFNGLGGFADGGREYVVVLPPGQTTPAPWINVVANPEFGFQVSAEGAGHAWRLNSREHQLTPWSNDPVTSPAGEALYVRDEETGVVWSPTALPAREPQATYVARHGRGYSRFECTAQGVRLELLQFAPMADPVKVSRLTLTNRSGRARRLSVSAYAEWVLGASRAAAAPFTTTGLDAETGAILARNGWNPAFGAPVAFADLGGAQTSWTGDRGEFIGRNGSPRRPAALGSSGPLSGRVGSGLDPCAALQTHIELAPGETRQVIFLLGEAAGEDEARKLVARWRTADLDAALGEVRAHWDDLLDAVQVRTPERAMDLLLNGWLLYQTLAARIWARCGFYQASGAYGFRDQLQDVMALAPLRPDLTREQILRAAARQFQEGDVQHWWLPHSGQGVRTRMTDDRVWLPYVVAHYIDVTGDASVLDEQSAFLQGEALAPGEAERFFQPQPTEETADLYEHCARALDRSLDLGGHGLPLFGTGDWNDGMNRVGERGLGESVWLGWFLHAALTAFLPFAEARGDAGRIGAWRAHREALRGSIERAAWDGAWYRRGWFDDGTPLGSARNDECRIDSIAQSWAVLSGAGRRDRASAAMAAVERELVDAGHGLALLFTPAFDRTPQDPGYIKAYPPGVRENGGQYTHAAAWSVMAFAALGDGDRAGRLFSMLNPLNHARTPQDVQRYRIEPYVAAGDVYAAPGAVGRGGWSWYTGSAAWLHRAGLESILGLRRQGTTLSVDPCIPRDWPGFEATVRVGASRYEILVENPAGVNAGVEHAELDGAAVAARPVRIDLVDDGRVHRLVVRLGRPEAQTSAARPRASAGP